MKNTTLDNPEIQVRDKRIVELDKIVTEVKESEEWEEVEMNIWDIAMTKGVELGVQQGVEQGTVSKLIEQVCKKLTKRCSVAEIADMLEEDELLIQKIADIAEKYTPEYDLDKIYRDLLAESKNN